MKKLLVLLLALFTLFSVLALTSCDKSDQKSSNESEKTRETVGLKYRLINNDAEYEVIGIGTATDTDIVLPSTYNDKPVTHIGKNAFYDCFHITSVTIPSSVILIDRIAFADCSNLKFVNFSQKSKLLSIGEGAFVNCTSLSVINIPSSVTDIDEEAFYGCLSLTKITIPDSMNSIGDSAFKGCYKLIEVYNRSPLNITAGDSNNGYVGYYAKNIYTPNSGESYVFTDTNDFIFYDNGSTRYLLGYTGTNTALTLPKNCNGKNYEIYEYAFCKNNTVSSIIFSTSVTSIGKAAFSRSESLTSITISSSVTNIDAYAFSDCKFLTNVSFDENCRLTIIEEGVFGGCRRLSNITLPSSVTSIGNYAFRGSNDLTSITLPTSLKSIGEDAFNACYKLIEVYNLSSLNIQAGKSAYGYIGYSARNIYTSLSAKSKLFTDSNGYIFYDDGSVYYLMSYTGSGTELNLPASCNGKNYELYNFAFAYNDNITNVILPSSVTNMGEHAFYNCKNLTQVTLSPTLKAIGECAFVSCRNLTSITIPASVRRIGMYAFDDCGKLTAATFEITTGWEEDGSSISSTDLARTYWAAEHLTHTYSSSIWER